MVRLKLRSIEVDSLLTIPLLATDLLRNNRHHCVSCLELRPAYEFTEPTLIQRPRGALFLFSTRHAIDRLKHLWTLIWEEFYASL